VVSGLALCLEEDNDEYINMTVYGIQVTDFGIACWLEEDRDEYDDFLVVGVTPTVPPVPPTEGGAVRLRVRRPAKPIILLVEEIMRMQNKVGISRKERKIMRAIVAFRAKEMKEIRSKLGFPEKIEIPLKRPLGKKYIEEKILTAIVAKYFGEERKMKGRLGFISLEDIIVGCGIRFSRKEIKGLVQKLGFDESKQLSLGFGIGIFYTETMNIASKLGLSEEEAIKIISKVRPSLMPILKKIWKMRRMRRE